MKATITFFARCVINSYAILFFSQNSVFGMLLLVVSFFNFNAGLAGLLCTCFSIAFCLLTGYRRHEIKKGLLSFNALLFGIGFGTFYHPGAAFFTWLTVGCLLCTIITVNLWSWLGTHKLPILSVPFILTFWILFSAANSVFQMGLSQKSSSILNELGSYNLPGAGLLQLPYYLNLFFRALSAILFQNNALAGLLICLGLLIHSRIALTVTVLGFITVCLFNAISGAYAGAPSYYHLGSNFMMTSMAIGSFFLIPSCRSYLWAVLTVPLTFLLVNAFTKIIGQHDLPVLSLPFCSATLMILYFFSRRNRLKAALTVFQHYSPEENLYQYLNGKERLNDFKYFNIKLPFLGSWTISQGYGGSITHKGEWGQALDFVIEDDDKKTYRMPGLKAADFYCFGKPVIACGDGIVENVVDHIEDNDVGVVNQKDNWGNTIVICHAPGLYSKVSHLKKKSAKVNPGDFVKQGDVIGSCGNSGRSPEPHLHFQIQTTPFIGSKTLSYPFSYYVSQGGAGADLNSYTIPAEGMVVHSLPVNSSLKAAFNFQPGFIASVSDAKGLQERFEVHTDHLNQTYIYSKQAESYAYFVNNGTTFYFTAFYGDKKSLLYLFYLAAYKVIFGDGPAGHANDAYPLQLSGAQPLRWLNDFTAPFFQFIKLAFASSVQSTNGVLSINSSQHKIIAGNSWQTMSATILVKENSIKSLNITLNGINSEVVWTTGNLD